MHLRIVETILHRAPTIVEHLGPLGLMVHTDAHVEIDPASAARATRATRCGRCCACALCSARRQRHRVDPITFAEEQRAAIARNVQIADAAAETTTATRATAFTLLRRLSRGNARQTTTVICNRVD